MNISLGVRIRGLAPRSRLPPQEQNQPDQEGGAHYQGRSQCRQILEHARLLYRPGSLCHSPTWHCHPSSGPPRPRPPPTAGCPIPRPAVSAPATEAARPGSAYGAPPEAVNIAQSGTWRMAGAGGGAAAQGRSGRSVPDGTTHPRASGMTTEPSPVPGQPAEPWATAPGQKRRVRRVPGPNVGPP